MPSPCPTPRRWPARARTLSAPEAGHALTRLAAFARQRGLEAHLVGGCVRDRLLGRPSADYDLVLGDAVAQARAFARHIRAHFVVLDAARGMARVVQPGGSQLDFAELVGPDLTADLARRDFTINALACELQDWLTVDPVYVDPHGGVADLRAGVLRAVTEHSLADDPLRALRGYRQAAVLGLTIEPRTEALIHAAAPQLSQVASERVHQEWFALLPTADCALAMRSLEQHGVLACLLPTLAPGAAERVERLEPLLEDCRAHSWLGAWLAEPERLELLRFAAVLQPQGPPAAEVVARFALSRTQRRALLAMRQPLPPLPELRRGLAAFLLRHGRDGLGAVLITAAGGGLPWPAALACLEQEVLPRLAENPLVTGDDLQRDLGVPPGPAFKAALDAARLAQLTGKVTTPAAALAVAQRMLAEG